MPSLPSHHRGCDSTLFSHNSNDVITIAVVSNIYNKGARSVLSAVQTLLYHETRNMKHCIVEAQLHCLLYGRLCDQ